MLAQENMTGTRVKTKPKVHKSKSGGGVRAKRAAPKASTEVRIPDLDLAGLVVSRHRDQDSSIRTNKAWPCLYP